MLKLASGDGEQKEGGHVAEEEEEGRNVPFMQRRKGKGGIARVGDAPR